MPDNVGASWGVAGALRGIDIGAGLAPLGGGSADIPTQVSQSTAQSHKSPSEYDSGMVLPVTSTGSP